jgi:hypothetical protein
VQSSDFVLVRGLADTRATLAAWNQRPGRVVARWVASSLAVSLLLLVAVWLVASLSTPDVSQSFYGVAGQPEVGQVWHVVGRNSLVLALHGFACLAGFIAGSSLPQQAERHSGAMRWMHDRAGPLAIAFVVCAIGFSLFTQALVLGHGASSLAWRLGISPPLLLVGLLPHALPELVALFLPLAAWMSASRRGDWHELLAATIVTVLLAFPVLVIAAYVEVFVSPGLLRALAG